MNPHAAVLVVGAIVLLLCAGFGAVILLGNLPGKKN